MQRLQFKDFVKNKENTVLHTLSNGRIRVKGRKKRNSHKLKTKFEKNKIDFIWPY